MLQDHLLDIILEVQFFDVDIPYLMATYKLHKKKYRWLTNAANYVFLAPTTIITHAMHLVIIELKEWCKLHSEMYERFSKVIANIYWVINSLFDFTLNLPTTIHNVCMADITW